MQEKTKKLYCDFEWKDNLISDFFNMWKEGRGWANYNKDRSVIGYIVLAIMFPFVCVIAIPMIILQFLCSFKIRATR